MQPVYHIFQTLFGHLIARLDGTPPVLAFHFLTSGKELLQEGVELAFHLPEQDVPSTFPDFVFDALAELVLQHLGVMERDHPVLRAV